MTRIRTAGRLLAGLGCALLMACSAHERRVERAAVYGAALVVLAPGLDLRTNDGVRICRRTEPIGETQVGTMEEVRACVRRLPKDDPTLADAYWRNNQDEGRVGKLPSGLHFPAVFASRRRCQIEFSQPAFSESGDLALVMIDARHHAGFLEIYRRGPSGWTSYRGCSTWVY